MRSDDSFFPSDSHFFLVIADNLGLSTRTLLLELARKGGNIMYRIIQTLASIWMKYCQLVCASIEYGFGGVTEGHRMSSVTHERYRAVTIIPVLRYPIGQPIVPALSAIRYRLHDGIKGLAKFFASFLYILQDRWTL